MTANYPTDCQSFTTLALLPQDVFAPYYGSRYGLALKKRESTLLDRHGWQADEEDPPRMHIYLVHKYFRVQHHLI